MKPEIKSIERTGRGYPDQWEGETAMGDMFYIRYRNNRLFASVKGTRLFDKQFDSPLDTNLLLDEVEQVFNMTDHAKEEMSDG